MIHKHDRFVVTGLGNFGVLTLVPLVTFLEQPVSMYNWIILLSTHVLLVIKYEMTLTVVPLWSKVHKPFAFTHIFMPLEVADHMAPRSV